MPRKRSRLDASNGRYSCAMLPIVKPIRFDVAGNVIELRDVRSQEIKLAGLEFPIAQQMLAIWESDHGEPAKLDGSEIENDPHQVGFAVFLNGAMVGSGAFLEVDLTGAGSSANATGRLLMSVPDYPDIEAAILEGANNYEAQSIDGSEFDKVIFHLV